MTVATARNPQDDLFPTMPRPPADVEHTEGIFTAWDGTDLFWQSWEPREGELRGVIALMHGFGEHSARYHHISSAFARRGYAVCAIDARGHGRSSGARAYVDAFDCYARDYDLLMTEIEKRWPDEICFAFGHSTGGLIALHHALVYPGRVAAYAVTSPFVGWKFKVPAIKAVAARLLSKVLPKLPMASDFDATLVSHDPAVVAKYTSDPLNLSVATPRWFTEINKGHALVLERASEIKAPFLFFVSDTDEVVDPRAAEIVYHALGSADRELQLLRGLKHEVLNEEGWEALIDQIVEWYERFR